MTNAQLGAFALTIFVFAVTGYRLGITEAKGIWKYVRPVSFICAFLLSAAMIAPLLSGHYPFLLLATLPFMAGAVIGTLNLRARGGDCGCGIKSKVKSVPLPTSMRADPRLGLNTGTVRWFNPVKGYGFIVPDGGERDVFVERATVEQAGLGALVEGQRVEFEVVRDRARFSVASLKVLGTPDAKAGRQTGIVKWYNPTKGYGFIQPDSARKDIYFHVSALERAGIADLKEGQKIEYDILTQRGRQFAVNLKLI